MATTLGWLVLALPLAGCLVLSLWPTEPPKAVTRIVGPGSILASFALTVAIFAGLVGDAPSARTHTDTLWRWVDAGSLKVDLAIRIDTLSVLMMLVITGVGFLIHVYSTEYMEHEGGYRRFFAEMAFFVFSMLLLVEAANFIFLIVGWAFVGLASYLLIGFYYDRPTAVAAAKKAFVINVIGDVGMVIAAFILARDLGTLDYTQVFANAPHGLSRGAAEAVALLLFVGAAAKSAQLPLHTWLADAMEGPTPVSALIHAATMVTAGVYLVVRTNPLYHLAPDASHVVAVVGALTLLMAATVAMTQVDIKRVLAWSTVSQIGYMIMGAGLGAYGASMFHFMTHAFFKALLFLGAGIVIHALAGEQSLDRMGGLRRHLRLAYVTMAIGCLAIAGVPGLSGFFSKDEILASAWDAPGPGKFCFVVGVIAAGLTAFYMFRLFFRTFHGPEPDGGYAHAPHPSGKAMAVPVAVLAVLSAVGGWIQVPGGWHRLTDWLDSSVGRSLVEPTHAAEIATSVITTVLAIAGIGLAWYLFAQGPARRLAHANRLAGLRGVLSDAYRVDRIYDDAVVDTTRTLGDVLATRVEPAGPQGVMVAAGEAVIGMGRAARAAQTGMLRTYAFGMILGLALAGLVLGLALGV